MFCLVLWYTESMSIHTEEGTILITEAALKEVVKEAINENEMRLSQAHDRRSHANAVSELRLQTITAVIQAVGVYASYRIVRSSR